MARRAHVHTTFLETEPYEASRSSESRNLLGLLLATQCEVAQRDSLSTYPVGTQKPFKTKAVSGFVPYLGRSSQIKGF